jgi:hypothetical protein
MTEPERDDSLAMALGDLDTYEAEVAKLNRQVEELAGENARLRQEVAAIEDANRRLSMDVAASRAERAAADSAAGVFRDIADRLQARLDTATAHVEELRGQRDEARAAAHDGDHDELIDGVAGSNPWPRLDPLVAYLVKTGQTTVAEDKPAPADPAGLDAAIAAARHRVRIEGRWPFEVPDHVLKPAVRAAAPHLRAAALNEAADSLAEQAIDAGFYSAQAWLRHLANGGGQ